MPLTCKQADPPGRAGGAHSAHVPDLGSPWGVGRWEDQASTSATDQLVLMGEASRSRGPPPEDALAGTWALRSGLPFTAIVTAYAG